MTGSLQLHVSEYQPHSAMAPHHHAEPWLCLVLEGRYQEHILSEATEHGAGALLYCPPFEPHAQRFGAQGARKVLFTPDASTLEYLQEHGVRLASAPSLAPSAALRQVGARLLRELEAGDPFGLLAAQGLALELVAAFGRGRDAERRPSPPRWLRRVRAQLDAEPAAGPALAQLARLAGKHPVHLARTFRRAYGCTIGDYLRRARAEKAAKLLRTTRLPLLEIALECGWSGASEFARSFKAAFDVTPSWYRQHAS